MLDQITNIALYIAAGWAYPLLKQLAASDPEAHPTILVTSSYLPVEPQPILFALSSTKAAQHNMTRSLAMFAEPDGIHVAIVSPCDYVTPERKNLNPTNIAKKAYELFAEPRGKFTLERQIFEDE
jgi:NAD(P)-dependent dehydrogenase (short-subunit alcohol dehydrogenase family)